MNWENTTNEHVLQAARDKIKESWCRTCADNANHPQAVELFDPKRLPVFHDPFAGGGALPLEAQRLGLEAYASDLNPVAVLINKAMIEIPPKYAARPPVNPENRSGRGLIADKWAGARGLAEDVRYYGRWMRDKAENRIGRLYPKIEITGEMVRSRADLKPYEGRKLTVIAWLWARTVKSPNPAFADVDVPLVSTFMLSTKRGKETYVEPVVNSREYRFTVKVGTPPDTATTKAGTKLSRGANFRCLMSGAPIAGDHIKAEGVAGRIGMRLMAIVADGIRGRVYLAPTEEHAITAADANPEWFPNTPLPDDPRNFWTLHYGLTTFGDLFTDRQLVTLTTFSDLVGEAKDRIRGDAVAAGLRDDGRPLRDGGTGATAYAEAIAVYLSFALNKALTRNCTLTVWYRDRDSTMAAFSRQAIPMTWDFTEVNPLLRGTGSIAFKQTENRNHRGVASTGWETFLEAVISAGFSVSGTWPVRTEQPHGLRVIDANALASSVVLVCRQPPADAPVTTRRNFIAALKVELPPALAQLQRGNIAPVDLAQAAIGPGMAVYTRYAKVLDASAKRVSVGEALALINQTLDEILAEQEGDFDADSRWALAWFEQHGFDSGDYGIAETLSKAKNTSMEGMVQAGILRSQSGNVRLLRPRELPSGWDPVDDDRLTTWEAVHHLIRVLDQGGEAAAATLVRRLGGFSEVARDLCYRLYTVCECKKRAAEALAYNGLVRSWPEISRLAKVDAQPGQTELFEDGNDGAAIS